MTFLSSLGTNPASLVALHMGPMWLLKVYGIALNTVKNIQELLEITCYHDMQFIAETNCSFRCLASPYILSGHSQCLLLFSRSVTSDSLQLDRLQNTLSLSFTISWSLLKLMSIELVMPSNHLVLCCPLLLCLQSFPTSGSFPMSQLFTSGDQSIRALASVSVLPVNIQGWFPLGLTGLISLLFKGLFECLLQYHNSKASILQHSAFFMVWLSPFLTTGKAIAVTIWTFEGKVMSLLFNVSRFVTTLKFTAKATGGSYEFVIVV